MSTPPLLQIQVQHHACAGRVVLRGLALSWSGQGCAAVLGPAGSGKSTLLRIACGLLQPDAGQCLLQGQPLRRLSPAVALLLPRPVLLPQLTLAQQVSFSLPPVLRARPGVRAQVLALLQPMGLAESADEPVGRLPAEAARRVALAQALFNRPQLLLVDDPMAGLDAAQRSHWRQLLARLPAAQGCGLLLAARDADALADLPQRRWLLRDLGQCAPGSRSLLALRQPPPRAWQAWQARPGATVPGLPA